LIQNLLFDFFDLVIWRILKIFEIIGIERRRCGGDCLDSIAALQELKFPQALL
jgi:hypothetical protein